MLFMLLAAAATCAPGVYPSAAVATDSIVPPAAIACSGATRVGAPADTDARVAWQPGSLPSATGPYLVVRFPPPLVADTPVRRTRAIEHSQAYYTRLTIHRYGSYLILPLFAGEYYVGQRLLNQEPTPGGLKGVHTGLALGVVGVFGLNTITGVWNLWEARHDSEGRARRTLHALTMLAADGGFASTVLIRPHRHRVLTPGGGVIREFDSSRATTHKDLAIASISLATASTVMMWLWR